MVEPVIYSPEEHRISPTAIDPDAVKVVRRLHQNGYIAYIVGGAVRDLLLGVPPKDFDVATTATPHEVRKLFRNSRLIGKRFRIVHVYFHPQKIIEVSTFRKGPVWEDESSIPIEAENNQWGTPEDDAFRRDLTINALFLDPLEMKVLDYVEGMVDLRERRIRVIGNPEVRFREDPVRTIRVIRHSARNSFVIDPHTWSSLLKSVPLIRSCNPNRVKQEFIREFQEGALHNSLKLLYRSELLLYLLPPLQEFLLSLESRLWKKRIYWRLLKMADEEFHRTPLPLTLNLACALGPAIYPEILGVGVPVIPKEELAHRFRPFLRFLGVPQKIGEEVGEILSSQGKLDLLRSEGKYPERLKEKRYFPLAFRLALFRYLAMGISIPEEWERRVPPVKGEKVELKPIPGEPGRFRIVTRTVRG